nr:specificity protein S [Rhizobium sp. TCK]
MSDGELTIQQLIDAKAIVAVQDGNHGGQHPKSREYTSTGIPFVMASDLTTDGRVDLENVTRLPKERCDRLRIGFTVDGDVLLTHKGTVGLAAIVRGAQPYWMLTPQVTYYRVNPELLNNKYLLYCFRSNDFQSQLANISAQSTRPYVSISTQRSLSIPWCDVNLQGQIASFLSAYDDLIEVNQRRIAILEDMARRLFDEWFVRFSFPGHEGVPLVETALGMVPDGWKPGTISDLSSFISRGLAPKYDDEASSLVINQKCIRDQALNLSPARKQSKPIPQSKLVIDGDILINSTGVGTLGRVAQLLGTLPGATVDTHVTIVRAAEEVDLHYFGLQLLQLQPHFERQGIGATGQTELSRTAIADTGIIIPPSGLANRFGRIAGPLRCQADLLRNQNNKLRAARDLLLPKLISGEIDVTTPEETFAEAAE